ncbi:MAG TPA: hypothetical protein VFQ68_30285 [Streptosporangiaceae bacterium]|nr:hypothetical protein [Streptosporangiaceae bacterium]
MTYPFSPAGDGEPVGPTPDATSAGSRAAGGAGPGVPLSIWPGLPESGGTRDGASCGGPVTVAAARRVIDTFSVPGDLVAAAGGCSSAVAEAAAAAGRRVLALVPDGSGGYPLPVPYPVARLRPGGPALVLAPGNPVTGQAALAVAGCCSPGCCEASGQDDRDAGLLFAACERVLCPGGVLAVIAGPAADGGPLTDTAGSVVAAARAAGLVYAQHIVLVRAEIDGDRLAPAAPGGSQVHDDLLVFTKPGGEARS